MKKITVFCGSSPGFDPRFKEVAFHLGATIASKGLGLVYGGANVGLMGAVADGALSRGGEVIGVLPQFLRNIELQHDGVTNLILVESMHERKTKMNDLSDGAIALPGGFGTMEEFFEMLTWGQLGLHQKPIALFNAFGFYDGLLEVIQNMVDKGFLKKMNQDMVLVGNEPEHVVDSMIAYRPQQVGKWISEKQT